jgi:hypothetical protein
MLFVVILITHVEVIIFVKIIIVESSKKNEIRIVVNKFAFKQNNIVLRPNCSSEVVIYTFVL